MPANAKTMIANLKNRASEHVMLIDALAALESSGAPAADILASATTVEHHARQTAQTTHALVKELTPAPAPSPTPST